MRDSYKGEDEVKVCLVLQRIPSEARWCFVRMPIEYSPIEYSIPISMQRERGSSPSPRWLDLNLHRNRRLCLSSKMDCDIYNRFKAVVAVTRALASWYARPLTLSLVALTDLARWLSLTDRDEKRQHIVGIAFK